MQIKQNRTLLLVQTGVLIALAIIIPLTMPIKFVAGPFSYTLASHVPIVLAMFVSPISALAVCIGSVIGFIVGIPNPEIWLRAATHIVWAFFGSFVVRNIFTDEGGMGAKWTKFSLWALVINFVHGLLEFLAVYLVFFKQGYSIKGQEVALGSLYVGLGLLGGLHGFVDFVLGALIYLALLPVFKKK